MQTMVIPDTSSEATVSREAASYGTMRAPRPCLPSNWASMADAASSSGPLPARQRTGASVRLVNGFFRRWFPVIVNREFGYQLLDRVLHPLKLFLVQNAALRVDGGE